MAKLQAFGQYGLFPRYKNLYIEYKNGAFRQHQQSIDK